MDKERWQGYVSGKIEGAINVLNLLEIDKDKKIEILSEAAGLSHITATEMLENS